MLSPDVGFATFLPFVIRRIHMNHADGIWHRSCLSACMEEESMLDWSAYESYGAGDAYAQIPANGGAFGKAASVCIGNRQCQKIEKGVMCPSYRATGDEVHSTRNRAAALKAMLEGRYSLSGPELDRAMDLCLGCKGCKRECPNGVDMALLKTEYLARRWKKEGVPFRYRIFGSLPRYVRHMKRFAFLLRIRNRIPFLAKCAEMLTGISERRAIPIPKKSFLKDAPAVSGSGKEVVLFVDTFSNHFDPEIAEAALEVLENAGCRVHVAKSERPLCCGRTYLSSGMVIEARKEARRLVEFLYPFSEKEIPVIGLEPSCLLMLRDEYHSLGLGEKAQKVSKSALLFEEFLAREKLDLSPLPFRKILVHGHCHQKAFGAMKAMKKVLSMIPELEAEFVESSCCGMAGSFGMEAEHYEISMKMAELSLLPKLREAGADVLLVSNGTSCRQQAGSGIHLSMLLRMALRKNS